MTRYSILQHSLKGHGFLDGACRSPAFSPDSRLLASALHDTGTVELRDVATDTLYLKLEKHSKQVRSIAFSPDLRLLASASKDKTVRLWDVATGALQQTLEGHSKSVSLVAFWPDGELIASTSDDRTIQLWRSETGLLYRTFSGDIKKPKAMAFLPNSMKLVLVSEDRLVHFWDILTSARGQQSLKNSRELLQKVEAAAFSPGLKLLALSCKNRVELWGAIESNQEVI